MYMEKGSIASKILAVVLLVLAVVYTILPDPLPIVVDDAGIDFAAFKYAAKVFAKKAAKEYAMANGPIAAAKIANTAINSDKGGVAIEKAKKVSAVVQSDQFAAAIKTASDLGGDSKLGKVAKSAEKARTSKAFETANKVVSNADGLRGKEIDASEIVMQLNAFSADKNV